MHRSFKGMQTACKAMKRFAGSFFGLIPAGCIARRARLERAASPLFRNQSALHASEGLFLADDLGLQPDRLRDLREGLHLHVPVP